MLENIALNAINNVAAQFVDLQPGDITIRITGDVRVRQVRIKQQALQYFCPALKIKLGTVNDIHIRAHYFRLKSVPITVQIRSVEIQLESLQDVKLTKDNVQQIIQEQFYQKLSAALSQQEAFQEFLNNPETEEADYNQLLLRIVHNARIEIGSVRVSYEDAELPVSLEINEILLERNAAPGEAQIAKDLTVGRISLRIAAAEAFKTEGFRATVLVKISNGIIFPELQASVTGSVQLDIDGNVLQKVAALMQAVQGIEAQFSQLKAAVHEEQKASNEEIDRRRIETLQKILDCAPAEKIPPQLHILQEKHELRQYMKLFCQHYLATVTKDGQQMIKIITKNTRANSIVYQFPFCKDYPVMCGDAQNNAMLHRLHQVLDLDDIVLGRRVVMQYISQWDKQKLIAQGFVFDAPDHAIRYMIDQHNSKAIHAERLNQLDRGQIKIRASLAVARLTTRVRVGLDELVAVELSNLSVNASVRGNDTIQMQFTVNGFQAALGGTKLIKADSERALNLTYDQVTHAFGVCNLKLSNFDVELNAEDLAKTVARMGDVYKQIEVHLPSFKALVAAERKNKFEKLRMYREGEALRRIAQQTRATMKVDLDVALCNVCVSVFLGPTCQHKLTLNTTNTVTLENTVEGFTARAVLTSLQLGSDLGQLVAMKETSFSFDSDEEKAKVDVGDVRLTFDLAVLSALINDARVWKDTSGGTILQQLPTGKEPTEDAAVKKRVKIIEFALSQLTTDVVCGSGSLVFQAQNLNVIMAESALHTAQLKSLRVDVNGQTFLSTSNEFLRASQQEISMGKLELCYRPNPIQDFLLEMCKGAKPLLEEINLLLPAPPTEQLAQKSLEERRADVLALFGTQRVVKPWMVPRISFQGMELQMMHHDRDALFASIVIAGLVVDENGHGKLEKLHIRGDSYDVIAISDTSFEIQPTSLGPDIKCILGPSKIFVSLQMARKVIHYAYTDMFNTIRYLKQLPITKRAGQGLSGRMASIKVDIPNILIEIAMFDKQDGLLKLQAHYLGLQIGGVEKDNQVMHSLDIALRDVSMDTCIGQLESRSIDKLTLDIGMQIPVVPDKLIDIFLDFSLEEPLAIQFDRAIVEQIIIRNIQQLVMPCSSVRLEKVRDSYCNFMKEQATILEKSARMAELVEAFQGAEPNFLIMNLAEFFAFVNKSFRTRGRLMLVGKINKLRIDLLQSLDIELSKTQVDLLMAKDMVVKTTVKEVNIQVLDEDFAQVAGMELVLFNNSAKNAVSFQVQNIVCLLNIAKMVDLINIFNPVLQLLVFPTNQTQAQLNKAAHALSQQVISISRYNEETIYGSDVFDETLTAILKSRLKKSKEAIDTISEMSAIIPRGQLRILHQGSYCDIRLGIEVKKDEQLVNEYSTLHEEAHLDDYTLTKRATLNLSLRDLEVQTNQGNQKLNSEISIPELQLCVQKKQTEYLDANSIKAKVRLDADVTINKPIRIQIVSQSVELIKGILEEAGRLQIKQSSLKNMPYMGRQFKMFNQLVVPYDQQIDSIRMHPKLSTEIEAVYIDNARSTHYPLLKLTSTLNSQHSTFRMEFYNQSAQIWQVLLDSAQLTKTEGESIHQDISKFDLTIDEAALECLNRCAVSLGKAQAEISEIKHLTDKYQLTQEVEYETDEPLPMLARIRAVSTQDVTTSSKRVFVVNNKLASEVEVRLGSDQTQIIKALSSATFAEKVRQINSINIEDLYSSNASTELGEGQYVSVSAQGLQTSIEVRPQIQLSNRSKLELFLKYADNSVAFLERDERTIPHAQVFGVVVSDRFTPAYQFNAHYDCESLDIPEVIQVSEDCYLRVQTEVVAQKLLDITLYPTFEITNDLLDSVVIDEITLKPGCTHTFYTNPEHDIKTSEVRYMDYSLKKQFFIYKHKSIGFKSAQSWSICKRIPLESTGGQIGNKIMVSRPIEHNAAIRGHYAYHAVLYASSVIRNFTDFDIIYQIVDEKQKLKQTYTVPAKKMGHVPQLDEGMTMKATLVTPEGDMTTDPIDTNANGEFSVQKYSYLVSYCLKLAPNRLTRYLNFFPGRVVRNRTPHDLELRFLCNSTKDGDTKCVVVKQKQEAITYASGSLVDVGGKLIPLQNRATFQIVYGDALLSLCCVQKNSIQFVDIFESQIQQYVFQNEYPVSAIVRQKLPQGTATEYVCEPKEQINLVLDDVSISPVFEVSFAGDTDAVEVNPFELGVSKSSDAGKCVTPKLMGLSSVLLASDSSVSLPATPALRKGLSFNIPKINIAVSAGGQKLRISSINTEFEISRTDDVKLALRSGENTITFETSEGAQPILSQRGLHAGLLVHKQFIKSAEFSLGTLEANLQQGLLDFAFQNILPRLPKPRQLYGFIASSTMSAGPVCIPVYPTLYIESLYLSQMECDLTVDISSLPLDDPRVKQLMQFARLQKARVSVSPFHVERSYGREVQRSLLEHLVSQGKKNAGSLLKAVLTAGEQKIPKQFGAVSASKKPIAVKDTPKESTPAPKEQKEPAGKLEAPVQKTEADAAAKKAKWGAMKGKK